MRPSMVMVFAAVGVAAIVAGVAWLCGPGWALIALGVQAVAASLLIYDPEEGRP